MDNEKSQLMVDIDGLQIKHRETTDLVQKAINDLSMLTNSKEIVTKEIQRLRDDFNVINNAIAEEKLIWMQEKSKEEKEIEEKKSKINEILAKETLFDNTEKEIDKKIQKNQDILNQSNISLEEAKRERVASQALVNQANTIKIATDEETRIINDKMRIFKEKIINFHAKLIEEFQ